MSSSSSNQSNNKFNELLKQSSMNNKL
jgi:hypothetical protein